MLHEFAIGISYEGIDRRTERRIGARGVRTGQVALLMDFRLLQLSAAGMLVGLTFSLPVGSVHPFALTVDGRHIEVQGEVLNCLPSDDEESGITHRASIRFDGLSEASEDLLEEYVKRALEEREMAELEELV